MIREFNLLATTSRGNEGYTRSELRYLLEKIGDPLATIERTGMSGLIAIKTSLDPFEVVEKLRNVLHDRPYEFRYTLRIIPVVIVVRTDLNEIQQAVSQLSSNITENETFRVTVEKRFSGTATREIVESAAAVVKSKVNLSKPDKIVLIEVVGALTGVSVIEPDDILSVLKEKLL